MICSKTKVYQLLALVFSIRKYRDNSDICILAADNVAYESLLVLCKDIENVCIYSEQELENKKLHSLKKERKFFQYCWTLKSIFCDFLISQTHENSTVTYVDADILFFDNVSVYLSKKKYSVFLTREEHFYPGPEQGNIDELKNIIGDFNSGFISFSNDEIGKSCLKWWMERCIQSCEISDTTFGDQKYLNEIPSLFRNVVCELTTRINVGPWNMMKREFTVVDDKLKFGDEGVLFFHYVGLKINNPGPITIFDDDTFCSDKLDEAFSANPSAKLVHNIYLNSCLESISYTRKLLPDFNGYAQQDKDDWTKYQKENDVFRREERKDY